MVIFRTKILVKFPMSCLLYSLTFMLFTISKTNFISIQLYYSLFGIFVIYLFVKTHINERCYLCLWQISVVSFYFCFITMYYCWCRICRVSRSKQVKDTFCIFLNYKKANCFHHLWPSCSRSIPTLFKWQSIIVDTVVSCSHQFPSNF